MSVADLFPTFMEVYGSTWKYYVASMEAGATCMEDGLPSTAMELGEASMQVDGKIDGSFRGSI